MTQQLGIGVLGLNEGRTLLTALNDEVPNITGSSSTHQIRAPHVRVVAACDLRQEMLDTARRRHPDLAYLTDYAELLKRSDVDIVAVYTPDKWHGTHIVQAFEAGKHVICTKPLINSMEDAQQILAASRRTGRKLMVGQSTRFFESFRRQRSAFERGEVGNLEFLDAHYVHRMDWFYERSPWAAENTDWVYLGMSHPIDLVRWYLGPIREVQAFAMQSHVARQYNAKSNDIYIANYRNETGQLGRAMGHFGVHELPSARNATELVLYGDKGTSMAQYHDMRYLHTAADGTEVVEDFLYEKRPYYFNNETHGMHYGEFANLAEYFAQALLNGTDYSPDLEEGLETFCIMEATRRSTVEDRPVEIAPLMEQIGLPVK